MKFNDVILFVIYLFGEKVVFKGKIIKDMFYIKS